MGMLIQNTSSMVTSADPNPLWTLNDLLSELNSLELQHGTLNSVPIPLKQYEFTSSSEVRRAERINNPSSNTSFRMCISDDDYKDYESEDEACHQSSSTGTRFTCNDILFSDSECFVDEIHKESSPSLLMKLKNIEEGALFQLDSEYRLILKEKLRSKMSTLWLSQENEREKLSFAMHQIEKKAEARREMDRRLDKQYQRRIAEIVDDHLSDLRRDFEQRSKIEERRIRDDAVLEEAKRKDKALNEERLRQEKAKTEAEVRLNAIKQAEAQKATLEAEWRAAKEAAEIEAARIREAAAVEASKKESTEKIRKEITEITGNFKEVDSVTKQLGIKVLASETALKSESNRLTIYNEVEGKLNAFPQKEIETHGRKMYRYIRQITGTVENAREKAHALVQLINGSSLPLSISVLIFAKKVVSLCESPNENFDKKIFACGWVILLVATQVPNVMELIVAEFNRACIYTVPKHLQASNVALQRNGYGKMLGCREVEFYIKLYAALIQTEINGVKNPHGLKEGWAWLAMFLNALPANRITAVALNAFLKMAGYALLRRYKSQFMKMLDLVSTRFFPALEQQGDAVKDIVMELREYLHDKAYLREPEGRHLQGSTMSRIHD